MDVHHSDLLSREFAARREVGEQPPTAVLLDPNSIYTKCIHFQNCCKPIAEHSGITGARLFLLHTGLL
jgi:hypothetical protein